MTFPDLLIAAIRRSEIPLRFEPGAEEAVAKPVAEVIRAWLEAHTPANPSSDFDYGQRALVAQLVSEVEGASEIPL